MSLAAEQSKARYDTRKAAGLCYRCGGAPLVEGSDKCEPCRESRRAWSARYYQRRRHPEAPAPAFDPEPMVEAVTASGESFVRACIAHRLPLDGIRCPMGHRIPTMDRSDEPTTWAVLHLPSGRIAGTVREGRHRWEPWFEAILDDTGKLTGRDDAGLSGKARLKARLIEVA